MQGLTLKIVFALFICLGYAAYGEEAAKKPNPFLSGALGAVIPGAGYLYNGDTTSAIWTLGLSTPLLARHFITTETATGRNLKTNLGSLSRNIYGFSVYDSFQQALDLGDRPELVVTVPRYPFSELITAPLKLKHYANLNVLLPVGLVLAAGAANIAREGIKANLDFKKVAIAVPLILVQSLFIGMGEETEFRGFYYPAFAELTGSRIAGNVMQGAFFGVCHTPWGVCSSPQLTGQALIEFQTVDYLREFGARSDTPGTRKFRAGALQSFLSASVMGMYLGYVSQSTDDGLLRSIALHSTWDALLLISDLVTNGDSPLYLSFNLPLSF